MPQLEVWAKVTWCIHIRHCCILNNIVPQILDSYVWTNSTLKLDYIRGQSICLVLYRQTEICFTSALIPPGHTKLMKGLCDPKGTLHGLGRACVARAWSWGGARTGLGSPAPLPHFKKGKTEQGMVNPNLCSVFHRDTLSAVVFQSSCWHPCCSACIYGGILAMGALSVSPNSVRPSRWQTVLSSMPVSF